MSTQAAPLHADHPKAGWYRYRRHKDARWEPCAIFRNKEGVLICLVGAEKRQEDPAAIWTWVADKAVAKEAAKFAFEHGYFPDEMAPAQLSNLPADPFEALKIEIEEQKSRAEEWLGKRPTIMSQVDCDLARNMQAELLKLNKRADAMFKAEKAPLLEASSACDDKYRFRAAVADVAERLRKVFGRFMAAEEDRQKAASAAKFREEQARIAAERAAIETAAKADMENDPIRALTSPPPEMPELPLAPEPVKVQAGGGVGRKAGLKDNWIGIIEDYPAALAHFSEHPDLRAAVQKLVTHVVRDAKGAIKLPGVKIRNERIPA